MSRSLLRLALRPNTRDACNAVGFWHERFANAALHDVASANTSRRAISLPRSLIFAERLLCTYHYPLSWTSTTKIAQSTLTAQIYKVDAHSGDSTFVCQSELLPYPLDSNVGTYSGRNGYNPPLCLDMMIDNRGNLLVHLATLPRR